jgi:hypothetical protein
MLIFKYKRYFRINAWSSLEFILPSLIASTSYCLELSNLIVFNNKDSYNASQYTALVALSYDEKASASNIFKNALDKIENYINPYSKSGIYYISPSKKYDKYQIEKYLSQFRQPNLISINFDIVIQF